VCDGGCFMAPMVCPTYYIKPSPSRRPHKQPCRHAAAKLAQNARERARKPADPRNQGKPRQISG
jgi:hypothetical protein